MSKAFNVVPDHDPSFDRAHDHRLRLPGLHHSVEVPDYRPGVLRVGVAEAPCALSSC
jgi:hypothetical protein